MNPTEPEVTRTPSTCQEAFNATHDILEKKSLIMKEINHSLSITYSDIITMEEHNEGLIRGYGMIYS